MTGHAADGRLPSDIDWKSIADPAATTIVYMPGKTIRELAETAIASGLAPKRLRLRSSRRHGRSRRSSAARSATSRSASAMPVSAGPLLVMIGYALAEAASTAGDQRAPHPPETAEKRAPGHKHASERGERQDRAFSKID